MIYILKQGFICSVLFCGINFFLYVGIYIMHEIMLDIYDFIHWKGKYQVKD